jgi:hypothetical protein
MNTRAATLAVLSLVACSNDAEPLPDASPLPAGCIHEVQCTDESVQQLDLFAAVSDGAVMNAEAEGVFTTTVDATGGGLSPTESFVYARFTGAGLEKVAIGDEEALGSTDWDIAFRRFLIRLNSGASGPSCVIAAAAPAGTDFATLSAAPAGLSFAAEAYVTDSCEIVPDDSGLGSAATALAKYWEYPGCVKMTGNVYVVQLADGRSVKLQVVAYYSLAAQMACDATGTVPQPSGSANFTLRWAFLP